MKGLSGLAAKRTLRVVGLMSGTSADGIDAAAVDISPGRIKLLAFRTYRYPPSVRAEVFKLFDPKTARVDLICHMNFLLGELFAQAVLRLCHDSGLPPESIDLIGSHGQTIYHIPRPQRAGGGPCVASTLQIGEPCIIAERTGITTVADFRPRDIAAGGQGAPLVPLADLLLLGHKKLTRAVQNIGGIANVTYLPAGVRGMDVPSMRGTGILPVHPAAVPATAKQPDLETPQVLAFDTGPGNMIMDRLTERLTHGRCGYDRGGRLAASGRVDAALLKELMRHPYLRRRPPKTSGREMFGAGFADELARRGAASGLKPVDVLSTATEFTAASIADAYRRFLPGAVDEAILCGGGSRNPVLVAALKRCLAPVRVVVMDELGIDADANEAVSFAILAVRTIRGQAGNVPSATGASRPVVLGKIVPGGQRTEQEQQPPQRRRG